MRVQRIAYGEESFQFGDLRVPVGGGPHPLVIVIHGGFWRAKYDLEYIGPVCEALTDEVGVATWNLEYRRIGNPDGGWPGTFDDVSAGSDHLRSLAADFNLDLSRMVALGHSAGGHLALWLGSQKKAGAVISLAGVADLRRAWELRLGNGVVADLLRGSPDEVPDRYRFASPSEHLPLGIPQRLIHGTHDESVPFEISERYVTRAKELGDDAELIPLENSGHLELVNPATKEFDVVRKTLVGMNELMGEGV